MHAVRIIVVAVGEEGDAAIRQPRGVEIIAGMPGKLLHARPVEVEEEDVVIAVAILLPAAEKLFAVVGKLGVENLPLAGVDQLAEPVLVEDIQAAARLETLVEIGVVVGAADEVPDDHHDLLDPSLLEQGDPFLGIERGGRRWRFDVRFGQHLAEGKVIQVDAVAIGLGHADDDLVGTLVEIEGNDLVRPQVPVSLGRGHDDRLGLPVHLQLDGGIIEPGRIAQRDLLRPGLFRHHREGRRPRGVVVKARDKPLAGKIAMIGRGRAAARQDRFLAFIDHRSRQRGTGRQKRGGRKKPLEGLESQLNCPFLHRHGVGVFHDDSLVASLAGGWTADNGSGFHGDRHRFQISNGGESDGKIPQVGKL